MMWHFYILKWNIFYIDEIKMLITCETFETQLTVNEAAAQLCVKDNALLTRRDELFALARQISREVTYKYTYRTTK